jgi:hypothetical protein
MRAQVLIAQLNDGEGIGSKSFLRQVSDAIILLFDIDEMRFVLEKEREPEKKKKKPDLFDPVNLINEVKLHSADVRRLELLADDVRVHLTRI